MDGRADQRRPEVVVGTWLVARAEAPNLVEAMLDGRQPADMTLPRLLAPLPAGWAEQRAMPGARARPEPAAAG